MTFIANIANNTLTLIGTKEQIELAESMLYNVDIRPAQVAIQVSIITLTETRGKTIATGLNEQVDNGVLRVISNGLLNFNDSTTTVVWDYNQKGQPAITSKFLESVRLRTALSQSKGKVLANPTVMAVSGTASSISLDTQVFAGFTTTSDATTGLVTQQRLTQSVGISLEITPYVSNDGTITMSLAPNISAIAGTAPDGSTLTSSTNVSVAQVRVKDGESIILGGLIQESDTSGTGNKVPFLGDLPGIGQFFRSSNSNDKSRSEAIVVVTPRILKEDGVPYFRKEWRENLSYEQLHAPDALPSQKQILPASHTHGGNNSLNIQSMEERMLDRKPPKLQPSGQPSHLPLSTFSEVLK